MDDRCGTDNSVVAGVGEQLHDGWVHPYFAGDRNRRGVDQDHPGTKNCVVHEGPEAWAKTFPENDLKRPLRWLAEVACEPAKVPSFIKRPRKNSITGKIRGKQKWTKMQGSYVCLVSLRSK